MSTCFCMGVCNGCGVCRCRCRCHWFPATVQIRPNVYEYWDWPRLVRQSRRKPLPPALDLSKPDVLDLSKK